MATVLLTKCSEVWVFGRRISSGMAAEIYKAETRGMPIRYFTEEMEAVSYTHLHAVYDEHPEPQPLELLPAPALQGTQRLPRRFQLHKGHAAPGQERPPLDETTHRKA